MGGNLSLSFSFVQHHIAARFCVKMSNQLEVVLNIGVRNTVLVSGLMFCFFKYLKGDVSVTKLYHCCLFNLLFLSVFFKTPLHNLSPLQQMFRVG